MSTFSSRISRKETAGSSCKKQIIKLKPSENIVFKEVYKILKYETLGQVILCCAQENFLQKWENIEQVGGVYISIIIKIITRSAEDFLPATSPSVLSVGSTITFKLLHYPKQMTSDKACQTVMVTQSSPWGQNSSGNLNVSLEDGWIMASSSNRSTKEKKSPRLPDDSESHSICEEDRGAMCSPNQTTCSTSRCWIAKCRSHFSWQSTLMKSTYP